MEVVVGAAEQWQQHTSSISSIEHRAARSQQPAASSQQLMAKLSSWETSHDAA